MSLNEGDVVRFKVGPIGHEEILTGVVHYYNESPRETWCDVKWDGRSKIDEIHTSVGGRTSFRTWESLRRKSPLAVVVVEDETKRRSKVYAPYMSRIVEVVNKS